MHRVSYVWKILIKISIMGPRHTTGEGPGRKDRTMKYPCDPDVDHVADIWLHRQKSDIFSTSGWTPHLSNPSE